MLFLMCLNDFLLSILSSIIASFIFIFSILLLLRPRVKISDKICLRTVDLDDKPNVRYLIKVVNLSLFPAYDIKVSLDKLIPYPVEGGLNYKSTQLKLKKNELSHIAPFRFGSNYGNNAMLFVTEEDVSSILGNPQFEIRFQVTLKHGVTGLTKVYNKNYSTKSSIKEGQFIFGKKIDII